MASIIENALNFGAGLFAYSRDQIEKTVQKLVDAGKVERADASKFTHEMVETGAQQRKEIQSMINKSVRENLQEMGITNPSSQQPLTAEDVRTIVREEIAASRNGSAAQ